MPTSDSTSITEAALAVLDSIYQAGFNYAKAGVMLLDLVPAERHQYTLDLTLNDAPGRGQGSAEEPPELARSRLMGILDQVNGRYGRGTVLLASAGLTGTARTWTKAGTDDPPLHHALGRLGLGPGLIRYPVTTGFRLKA